MAHSGLPFGMRFGELGSLAPLALLHVPLQLGLDRLLQDIGLFLGLLEDLYTGAGRPDTMVV